MQFSVSTVAIFIRVLPVPLLCCAASVACPLRMSTTRDLPQIGPVSVYY